MKKIYTIGIALIALALLLIPLIFYYAHFKGGAVSSSNQDWGNFGDYLNGTFTPLIALAGVIVSLAIGLMSEQRNVANLKIEQQKHRPLLQISYNDMEEEIRIWMINKGNGPLLIDNYKLVHLENGNELAGIFNCLPPIHRSYDNYTGNQNNTVLSPMEEFELLLLELGEDDDEIEFDESKLLLRNALSSYKIVVKYKDVYNEVMPIYEKSLAWFGRNSETVV